MTGAVKRGLVLEGGGIRSAYLAGALLALWDAGIRDFDVVAGTSAGACCGANFIAGEPYKNKIILEDYLTGKNFVKLWNIPTKKHVVDIGFLIDQVCVKHIPLDLEKIRNAKATLYISAVDFLTGEAVYFNNREDDLLMALKASCALPYLYRQAVYYRGRRYLDGGLGDSIPVKKVLLENCQEIIVISTREVGYRKQEDKIPLWLHQLCYPSTKALGFCFKKRHALYNETLDLILKPPDNIKIWLMAPQKPLKVGRTTSSRHHVVHSVEQGYKETSIFIKDNFGIYETKRVG